MHLFMGSHDPHIVVNVTAQNDAPSGADNSVTTSEDTAYSFTAADFGFSDGLDNNALLAVEITTLPAAGALTLDDVAVNAGDFISVADIDAGKLKFVPFENAHGASYAGFSFQVQDDGGTANSGADLDPSANTITIDVVSVNDAPSGASSTITAVEDTARVLTAADFGFSDAIDGDAFSAVTIGNLPAAGTLLNNGVAVTAGQSVSIADINAGHLAFQAALNANGAGYASFDFHVQDDGGTSNGGVDLDQTANTLTIDVTAVNDAPSAVVLSNQRGSFAENVSTTARIKVADIAIADVDGGANNLSLAGARRRPVPDHRPESVAEGRRPARLRDQSAARRHRQGQRSDGRRPGRRVCQSVDRRRRHRRDRHRHGARRQAGRRQPQREPQRSSPATTPSTAMAATTAYQAVSAPTS